jgi:hypothetical protein
MVNRKKGGPVNEAQVLVIDSEGTEKPLKFGRLKKPGN